MLASNKEDIYSLLSCSVLSRRKWSNWWKHTTLVFLLLLLFLLVWCQRDQIWEYRTSGKCVVTRLMLTHWTINCIENQMKRDLTFLGLICFPYSTSRLPRLLIKVCPVWLHSVWCPHCTGTDTGWKSHYKTAQILTQLIEIKNICFPPALSGKLPKKSDFKPSQKLSKFVEKS